MRLECWSEVTYTEYFHSLGGISFSGMHLLLKANHLLLKHWLVSDWKIRITTLIFFIKHQIMLIHIYFQYIAGWVRLLGWIYYLQHCSWRGSSVVKAQSNAMAIPYEYITKCPLILTCFSVLSSILFSSISWSLCFPRMISSRSWVWEVW